MNKEKALELFESIKYPGFSRDIVSFGIIKDVEIEGKKYECMDRLAKKYDDRFDINCDKNMACPYEVTGKKIVTIYEVSTEK